MAANSQLSQRQQALDLLRFPLAIVILTIHVWSLSSFDLKGSHIDPTAFPLSREINFFIDAFFRGQSVPIYFFISGFVFFFGVDWNRQAYFRKLKNRVKTLLIPYLIWNTVAIGMLTVKYLPFFERFRDNYADFSFGFKALLACFWNYRHDFFPALLEQTDLSASAGIYPIDGPLWFLRDLMIVVAVSPLLYRVLKQRGGELEVAALGVAWFVSGYWNLQHINQLLSAFFFFSWGAVLSIRQKDMLTEFGRYFTFSMWAYPVLALLHVGALHFCPEAAFTIKRLNILAGLLFAYNAAAWLLEHHVCKPSAFLASSSFFIYATHELIRTRLRNIFCILIRPRSDAGMLVTYSLIFLSTLGILLTAFYLLRRYAPRLLKVIAGRQ